MQLTQTHRSIIVVVGMIVIGALTTLPLSIESIRASSRAASLASPQQGCSAHHDDRAACEKSTALNSAASAK